MRNSKILARNIPRHIFAHAIDVVSTLAAVTCVASVYLMDGEQQYLVSRLAGVVMLVGVLSSRPVSNSDANGSISRRRARMQDMSALLAILSALWVGYFVFIYAGPIERRRQLLLYGVVGVGLGFFLSLVITLSRPKAIGEKQGKDLQ